jgi:UDP-N-acetylmuramoylalanine--D-glutamate ligase
LCPAKIIGITGTRGKSTTTSLIAHLLQKGKEKVWWGGNIGKRSPLEFLSEVKKSHLVVLELSSWMLESLHEHKLSPHVAVLLNVQEDHLNRYKGMEAYAEAKEYITMHQKPEDTLICNYGNAYTRSMGERSSARVIWFDRATSLPQGYSLDGTIAVERLAGKQVAIADMRTVPLRGEHNYENILAAIACARWLGLAPETIAQELAMFASLPGRLQFIDEINGVTFVNDTTATTPSAGLAALSALKDRPIIMIAGGSDKELGFKPLAQALATMVKAVVWLPGTGTDRFKAALPADTRLNQVEAGSMQEAVKQAFSLAQSGDIVLLSPSCASFGLFKNEFDRGDQFNSAIASLAAVMR